MDKNFTKKLKIVENAQNTSMKRVLFYGNSDTAWSQWLKNKDKTLLFKRKGSDVNF